ncbi:alginate export family protein [Aureibacter tunicatorum]|uniref:Alginate export domain-containing protein n=1 Tax=Aureibacter tunicatorum TaxID=866807 RepID=A0AAE4BQ09_9BACT|nr:alginate export family protein [Aureibacter tunicatorum]MDR6237071.1 hypothetical protein [Aureibacter tunicatorum]BDD06063.1 hypothetical protein AUTU_35460 [Aureibacter tunicatorum]
MKRNFTVKSFSFSLLFFLIISLPSFAQEIKIDAQLRPRGEMRHGVFSLVDKDQDAIFGVTQRARINFHYDSEKIKIGFSVQDVRTWGDTQQAALNDGARTAIARAWAEVFFLPSFSLKLGRQAISYDDERIFGALDWANQGRFHDAGIFRFSKNGFKADLGLAFNRNSQAFGTPVDGDVDSYYNVNNYKNMQYLWLHKDWETLKLSLLFINNGYQASNVNANNTVTDSTNVYTQTYGFYLEKEIGNLDIDVSFYIQSGEDRVAQNNVWVPRDVSAYLWAIWLKYHFTKKFNVHIGSDYLSGTELNGNETKNKSFNPSFGTNHKFYGIMDYFYAGNGHRNVGLWDAHIGAGYTFSKKFKADLTVHNFTSTAQILQSVGGAKEDDQLGTEFDLTFGYNPTKGVAIIGGYSQMVASTTMETLKGGDSNATQNWLWAQVNINPTIFKWKKKKEK